MPDLHDDDKTNVEPYPEDIGYCSVCDCEIHIPSSDDGLCAHCRADEVAP